MLTPGAGRLLARPPAQPPPGNHIPIGMQPLGLAPGRDGVLYVSKGYAAGHPAPLLVLLHGAGGEGRGQVAPFRGLADERGLILLGPDSRGRTWDMLMDGFGPDITFLDQALGEVFSRVPIKPESVAVGGFSDGASYALSVGLTNGDLFNHIVSFSPGFMAPAAQRDRPQIYISHGTQDSVLPIDRCSRRIVPRLRRAGYEVSYHEFLGGHTVPSQIAMEAFNWLTGQAP